MRAQQTRPGDDVLTVGEVDLDLDTRRVRWRNRETELSRTEFELLRVLMSRPNQVVTRDILMREVWETTFFVSTKIIYVHLSHLRRKLGDNGRNPELITTVRGRGLRFNTR